MYSVGGIGTINTPRNKLELGPCIQECGERLGREKAPMATRKRDMYTQCYNKIMDPRKLHDMVTCALIMGKQHVIIFDECTLTDMSIDFIEFFTSPLEGKPSLYALLNSRISRKDFIIYIERIADEDINHVVVKLIWRANYIGFDGEDGGDNGDNEYLSQKKQNNHSSPRVGYDDTLLVNSSSES